MTNIYKNIYLRKEEEVLYNIRKNVDETVETPTISKIIDYVLADPYEHIIYMDVKLKMVTSYDATNVFVDTGYKNMSGEPLFLSLVLKDDVFTGKYVGTIDQLGNAILTIVKMRVNEQEIYDNMEFLKNNYGNYKQFVDDWDLKAGEREKDNNLGDMSTCLKELIYQNSRRQQKKSLQLRIQQLHQNQIFMKKIWMLNQKMGRNYC